MKTTNQSDERTMAAAKILNCTPEQVRAQLAKNAKQLRDMESQATATGKKVNGYTASNLNALALSFEQRSYPTFPSLLQSAEDQRRQELNGGAK